MKVRVDRMFPEFVALKKRELLELRNVARNAAAPDGAPPRRIREGSTALAPPCPERGPEAGRHRIRIHYFKPLSRTILQYVDHSEHKYKSNVGISIDVTATLGST